jgi:outer membrane immunogenic protein
VRIVKRIFFTAILLIATAGTSLAADLPQAPPPPQAPVAYVPAAPPVYNWGGIYVGINGGYGFGTAKWTVSGNGASSDKANGGIVGGTLGANFQTGAFVFGVEGDFDWSGINSSTAGSVCVVTGNCQTGNTWLSTLRGRVGFAMDRVLFYGTGGGVFGNEQITQSGVTTTHTQAGWTAGVGVEVAFAENWTAKLEYLYANLGTGSVTCTTACGVAAGMPGIPVSVGLTDNLIRLGVNFKFNF